MVTGNTVNEQVAIKATYFSILGNIVLAGIKTVGGVFGNSYALIADAIESTADVCASFLVLFGLKYASRPADENHPYGHGRAEPLITFIVVGFLIASSLAIAYQSILNIRTPHALPERWTLLILAPIIVWKEISYRIVLRKAKQSNSSSLTADAWHHRSDAITSVSAFIGISIALFGGEGFETADDWAALFASGFILYNAYLIFRPALGEIMDEHVHDDLRDDIRRVALTVEGVVNTEKCYIRKAGMSYQVDLHAHVGGELTVREGHEIAHRLKDQLQREIPQLRQILIHIEPAERASK